jgi:hypothetical protein
MIITLRAALAAFALGPSALAQTAFLTLAGRRVGARWAALRWFGQDAQASPVKASRNAALGDGNEQS